MGEGRVGGVGVGCGGGAGGVCVWSESCWSELSGTGEVPITTLSELQASRRSIRWRPGWTVCLRRRRW